LILDLALLGPAQDQNRDAESGLQESVERLDAIAIGQCRVERLGATPLLRNRSIPLGSSVTHSSLSFVLVCFAVLISRIGIWLIQKRALLALDRLGRIRRHKAQHLLLQLRIHLVRDGHNIGKQHAEFQILHVFVQR
jgi:hypothetical protein